jgi:hypothetical protein
LSFDFLTFSLLDLLQVGIKCLMKIEVLMDSWRYLSPRFWFGEGRISFAAKEDWIIIKNFGGRHYKCLMKNTLITAHRRSYPHS